MKMKLVLIVAVLIVAVGCRSQKMEATGDSQQERPVIEKETDIAVEVDHTTGIMSLEESFSFTRDEDKLPHDERKYFVIIGSFRNKDNADRYSESLSNKGFNPVILLSETGLHRVSVDSYEMENDARERIMQIRSQFIEHEDTWLLVRK